MTCIWIQWIHIIWIHPWRDQTSTYQETPVRKQPGVSVKMRPNHWYLPSISLYISPKIHVWQALESEQKSIFLVKRNIKNTLYYILKSNPWIWSVQSFWENAFPTPKLPRPSVRCLGYFHLERCSNGMARSWSQTWKLCVFRSSPLLNEETEREALEIEKLSG